MVLVRQLPDESATVRAVGGTDVEWSLIPALLAHVADLLAVANWQRQGKAGAARPDRIPRPGVKSNRARIGTASLSPAELRRTLAEFSDEEVESSP